MESMIIHFKGKFIHASFALPVPMLTLTGGNRNEWAPADRRTLHEIETKRKLIAATVICPGIIWTNRDNCLSYIYKRSSSLISMPQHRDKRPSRDDIVS